MEKLYLDVAIVLFFLSALILASESRKKISHENKKSYKLICGGLCTLSVMNIVSMMKNQFLSLFSIPLTTIAAVEVIQWVLLVSGIVMITSGISRYLPSITKRAEKLESCILETERLKRLCNLISSPASLDEFMRASLEVIADCIGTTTGAIYAVSKSKESAKLMASYGTFKSTVGITDKFVISPNWLDNLHQSEISATSVSFSNIHPDATGYCHCLLMKSSGGRPFLYLLWAKDKHETQVLSSYIVMRLTEALNARLTAEKLFLINEFNRMFGEFARSLKNKVAVQQSANEMLLTAKTDLEQHVPVEFISIYMMHADGTGRRISIGRSGTLLNEVDVYDGPGNSYLNRVIASGSVMYFKDTTGVKEVSFPALLSVSRIKSIVATPLTGAAGTKGVLTIGAGGTAKYNRTDLEIVKRVSSSFELILSELALEKRSEVIADREKLLNAFINEITVLSSEKDLYKRAAGVISTALRCSIVRISTVEREKRFLNSRSLVNAGTLKIRTPEQGHLILSLLPWHDTVQKNGSTVIVNCGPDELSMPAIETMQVFSTGIKTAVIVPIKLESKILGMISLGDEKIPADTSLTDENIKFVETIASLLAVSSDATTRREDARADFAVLAKAEIIHSGQRQEMRTQLKSSLTSIIGSLDMIKSSRPQNETRKDKFLDIIDKSAKKMSEYLSEANY